MSQQGGWGHGGGGGYGPPPGTGGYGPPSSHGYGPQHGYGPMGPQQMPPPPQPESGWGVLKVVLIVVAVMFVGVGMASNSVQQAETKKQDAVKEARRSPAAQADLKVMLDNYKANEVAADGAYQGKAFRVTGKVNDISKSLGGGSMYIVVGTGARFEFPALQCSLDASQQSKVASLQKGQSVTVVGNVTGLMMNVQMNPCEVQ